MPGDGIHAQQPEDEQHQREDAHDDQRYDQEAGEAVQTLPPLPVAASPRLFEHRKRLRRHPETDLTGAVAAGAGSDGRWLERPSPGSTIAVLDDMTTNDALEAPRR
jgi:hypothetical protein